MAQTVARLARTLQFAGSIPAVLFSFALESMMVGHTYSVYAFELLKDLV